jgi:hypothetical protein
MNDLYCCQMTSVHVIHMLSYPCHSRHTDLQGNVRQAGEQQSEEQQCMWKISASGFMWAVGYPTGCPSRNY